MILCRKSVEILFEINFYRLDFPPYQHSDSPRRFPPMMTDGRDGDGDGDGDGGDGLWGGADACGALVRKLRHPLAAVRARALQSLRFKLRERLVGVAQLAAERKALAPRLLAALREPELELDALQVLQLVVQVRARVLAWGSGGWGMRGSWR